MTSRKNTPRLPWLLGSPGKSVPAVCRRDETWVRQLYNYTLVRCGCIVGIKESDVKAMDGCKACSASWALFARDRLGIAHSMATAPARHLQMEWRNFTIPMMSLQVDTMAWKNCTAMKVRTDFEFLPWTSNLMAWEVIEVFFFFSFKLCGNLCIEVHLNRLMHNMRQSFGVFNGCDACQVCHRQACLPASKFEKKDMT